MNYLKEIEKEIKGKTFIEQMQVVKKYVIFDSPNNVGVYQIENFYIGKSNNILSRITHHIKEVLLAESSKIIYNKNKLYLIKCVLEDRKLKIKHLNKNPSEEKKIIEKLFPILPLTNIEFVTENMKIKKQVEIIKSLKYKTIYYKSDKFANKYYVSKIIMGDLIIIEMSDTYELAKKKLKKYITAKIPHKKPRSERKSFKKKNK